MITQLRYTIAPPYVECLMAVKNKVEIDGLTLQSFILMLTEVCTS
jgi:predicted DNA binding CopG/RHH family protein